MPVSLESTPEKQICDTCSTFDTNLAYCSPCYANLCPRCLGQQAPHRPLARRLGWVLPHEKFKLFLSRKLSPPSSLDGGPSDKLACARPNDLVVSDLLNRINFGVGGRYDILLAKYPQNKRLSPYPSLGCFIGSSSKHSSSLDPTDDTLKL